MMRNHCAFGLLFLAFASHSASAQAVGLVPSPVMVPAGINDFVGSTSVSFHKVNNGRIFYTVDGTFPTNKSLQYQEGSVLVFYQTTTVNAVHYLAGFASEVVTGVFTRAKVSAPQANTGGKADFYPSVICTLTVAKPASEATIYYTLDGTDPGSNSPVYSGPLPIAKSTTVKAYATAPGYDDSDPMQAAFTLLPPLATPVATPKSESFPTNTLTIHFVSAPGAYFRYSLNSTKKTLDTTAALLSGDSLSIVGGKIGDTVTVRCRAFKTGSTPSAVLTEKYVYLPAVATPLISRPAGIFYDSATVFLGSTDGASIHYVLDNSPLTENSADGSQPILLTTSATLKARAYNPPQPYSAVLSVSYTLRLTPPDIDKPSQQFVDSLKVQLKAKSPKAAILYTLDGTDPTLKTGFPLDSSGVITIQGIDSTVLKAIAVKDGIQSSVATATYSKKAVIKKFAAPIIEPATRDFEDSISLTMHTPETDAEIHYTTDGSDPSLASPKFDGIPLHLESSTVVRAQSFPLAGGKEPSVIREERYGLLPSQPTASPAATLPYANSVLVTLSTRTKIGIINYTLADAPLTEAVVYSDSKPILLTSTTRLKAWTTLAIGGVTLSSSLLDVNYQIYTSTPSDTLAPGSTRSLSGGFAFTNQSSLPIIAKTHTTDAFNLIGFRDVSLAVQLQPAQSGQVFKVTLTKPVDANLGLYRYANGLVEFITSDSQKDLTVAGDYFLGVDTMPPVITLLSEVPKAGDATQLRLSVKDNVSNVTCEIQSPGLSGDRGTYKPDGNGEISVPLKISGTELRGLWFRASAGDFFNTGRLPKEATGKVYLSQLWNRLNTPSVISLGRKNSSWDMVGFPTGEAVPIHWNQLRLDNPEDNLDAAVWSESNGVYLYLNDSSIITPGKAIWLGSRVPVANVILSTFRTGPSGTDGTYRMLLHPGWNQITSPSLDKVYWPVSTAASKLSGTLLKAPFRYLPETDDYVHSDSLEPWRGYFVNYFSKSNRDTIITLVTDPALRPVPKAATGWVEGTARSVDLNLDIGRAVPLNLGAQTDAQDGMGAEDEPVLPGLARGFPAWAQRGHGRLLTDIVHYTAGMPLRWDVVIGKDGALAKEVSASGTFRVLAGTLPAGYQAWAVSSLRGMKFQLETGMEMPLSALAGDTLSVYAGPLDKLSGLSAFAKAAAYVGELSFKLERSRNGGTLQLALPWPAEVDASVWSPAGRLLGASRPGMLNQGIYHLPMAVGSQSQIGFLRLRLKTEKGLQVFSQKVLW